MADDDAHAHELVEEENYFVSMTDMMVGLVFIFVILLMYFVLQFTQTTEALKETNENLTSADETRAEILKELERSLKDAGIIVSIDQENGVLRLPEELLFARGSAQLTPDRLPKLNMVADALATILPDYTDTAITQPTDAAAKVPHKIEAVFIEGHTDDTGDPSSNWSLSAARAITTFQNLTARQPLLGALCSRGRSGEECVPVLSVSGYGFSRPIEGGRVLAGDNPAVANEKRDKNRRIDIRILMKAPLSTDVREQIEGGLDDAP